ncbi:MAG: 4Fe-4S dicluster domain-containing protein [FCB group bacterium]|jgi:Fe-S-cluster-containing dehydrogenase component|nr:4Fe-4S dicluster domain-containing protein [FCB group bacterium]
MNRRRFLQLAGVGAVGGLAAGQAGASEAPASIDDGVAVLVDTTECIGCRKCEFACNREHKLSDAPLEAYEDTAVFAEQRRMPADAYTVINRHHNPDNPEKPIYVKSQCMHCLEPACVSACLVKALTTADNGSVVYNASRCMGCRYCMVACPFQVPAYEYDNAFTPQVRKCIFCFDRIAKDGKMPACVEMCPTNTLTFGKRSEVIKLAHDKIAAHPARYKDKVYGETEVGGTRWLYLASQSFDELGFLKLGADPIPKLTESIQHGIFKYGIPPLMLFGLLGAAMSVFRDGEDKE